MFECGDALTALRDLNEAKIKKADKPKALEDTEEIIKQVKKVNALGSRALDMYNRLLATFLTPVNSQPCEFYEEKWLRYVLVGFKLSHFPDGTFLFSSIAFKENHTNKW